MQVTVEISDEILVAIAGAVAIRLLAKQPSPTASTSQKWRTHIEAVAYEKKTPAALYKLSSERRVRFTKRGKQNYYRPEDLDKCLDAGFVYCGR